MWLDHPLLMLLLEALPDAEREDYRHGYYVARSVAEEDRSSDDESAARRYARLERMISDRYSGDERLEVIDALLGQADPRRIEAAVPPRDGGHPDSPARGARGSRGSLG